MSSSRNRNFDLMKPRGLSCCEHRGVNELVFRCKFLGELS